MSKPQSRPETSLNSKLERSLATYAVAAGAAGVGLLAMVQPAKAEIMYKKTHVVLNLGDTYQLDLNNDGTADFVIHNFERFYVGHSGTVYDTYNLSVRGPAPAGGVEAQRNTNVALAMKAGKKIGPKKFFVPNFPMLMVAVAVDQTSHPVGSWVNVKNRYLGFQLPAGIGHSQYGWARMKVEVQGLHITATINGYAYETKSDKPIAAGDTGTEPTSLGHLALGAAGRK